jgi:hypothetical protein
VPPFQVQLPSSRSRPCGPERPVLFALDQEFGEGPGLGVPQNSPIRSARSKSGSVRTWSSPARGAGPRASNRFSICDSISLMRGWQAVGQRDDEAPGARSGVSEGRGPLPR